MELKTPWIPALVERLTGFQIRAQIMMVMVVKTIVPRIWMTTMMVYQMIMIHVTLEICLLQIPFQTMMATDVKTIPKMMMMIMTV